MKKVILGLVFTSVLLGACSTNKEATSAKANSTTESSLRKEVSDLKSENEELNKRVTELKNLIENSSTQDSSENNSDSASGNVKMGQAVEFTSGESITITEVKADDSISLMDPVDGEHPVVVTAIIENKTNSPISFNAHTFDIYDGNDELGRLDANTYSNNIPNEIAGGKKATVVMYFGAKGNAPYTIAYGPATWSE
ncbi:TPA: DUF4352 domain-containing protein [Enterococcus faecium]|uniref:DUF4352 domain-containing protein n=1 Tax=Enterococcus faecium TaxID=1352 RepID=UPI00111FE576|nr:DUF4352 domain-containing protein [Enterococcus faecium]TNX49259.1 DUF4352 domain-containing protein [Enterococcus faecium]HAQ2179877.1 DUF4352 domain-containing protein [Enterococcus faecium]